MNAKRIHEQQLSHLKALFLCSTFNGLTQKVWVHLKTLFQQSELMLGIQEEAIHQYQPDLIICPYLKEYIPDDVWQNYPSFIIHPGPPGDGGANSLNWAVLRGETTWGVSILQAGKGWDRGPAWGAGEFQMTEQSISSIYRLQLADKVLEILPEALERYFSSGNPIQSSEIKYRPRITQKDLNFDWHERGEDIMRKINAGDSLPGTIGRLSGRQFKFYGAKIDHNDAKPGCFQVLDDGELCVGTGSGSIRISRLADLDGIKVRPINLLSD